MELYVTLICLRITLSLRLQKERRKEIENGVQYCRQRQWLGEKVYGFLSITNVVRRGHWVCLESNGSKTWTGRLGVEYKGPCKKS